MDIGNISDLHSNVYKTNNPSASKLESKLEGDFTKSTDAEMLDACKQFEAYFVEQMFKSMMATVPKNEDSSSYATNMMDYYTDEMTKKLAEDTAEGNSLGLAQTLYEQMKRNYDL